MKTYILSFIVILISMQAYPQLSIQNIELTPGWNAVYLNHTPEPERCDELFAHKSIESVWGWNRKFNSVQFISDASEILSTQPEWLTWYPPDSENAFLNSLYRVQGSKAYLIKVADNVASVKLVITGLVSHTKVRWNTDSYNLKGFEVGEESTPTFADYFATSPAHHNQSIFTLNANGTWQKIEDLSLKKIESGKAYWIMCKGSSDFQGPLEVTCRGNSDIDFSDNIIVKEITIKNDSNQTRTYTVKQIDTPVGAVNQATPIGSMTLSYWHSDYENKIIQWRKFETALTKSLDPGKSWTIRLKVNRNDMNVLPNSPNNYDGLIKIDDGHGNQQIWTIKASKGNHSQFLSGNNALPRNGLWVGYALVKKVSNAHGSDTPAATPATLKFRLIMHQDKAGKLCLLHKASVVLNKNDQTNMVIVTNDKLVNKYVDGKTNPESLIGQRFSSIVFGMQKPLTLSYVKAANTISGRVFIGYNDPKNPFKHLYHPDHNNLDDYTKKLPEGEQSYDVTRDLTLQISSTPIAGVSATGWGDTVVGGVYKEKIQGLYHKPIYVEGFYALSQVSDVEILISNE